MDPVDSLGEKEHFGVEGAFLVKGTEEIWSFSNANHVEGVLSPQECIELLEITETMGYTNETHPNYQNVKIDKLEQKNRDGSDR